MLLAFIGLAIVVGLAPLNLVDLSISLEVQRLEVGPLLRSVSWLGYWPKSLIVPIVVIVGLWAIRWRREAVLLAVTSIGAVAICHIVRVLDPRARPGLPVHVEDIIRGSGFPSGHVMDYVALCGFCIVILRHRKADLPAWSHTVLLAFLLAMIVLVGPSRIWLGAHWPTDVLGGYLLGGWWVTVMARLYRGATWR